MQTTRTRRSPTSALARHLSGREGSIGPLTIKKPVVPVGITAKFPHRPDAGVVSELIPLFFIARNRAGLWVAREAEGHTGGIFLFKRSAVRFAEKSSAPRGCATMFRAEHFELDVENRGNQLIGWIGAVLNVVARYIPEYPPPIPLLHAPAMTGIRPLGNRDSDQFSVFGWT